MENIIIGIPQPPLHLLSFFTSTFDGNIYTCFYIPFPNPWSSCSHTFFVFLSLIQNALPTLTPLYFRHWYILCLQKWPFTLYNYWDLRYQISDIRSPWLGLSIHYPYKWMSITFYFLNKKISMFIYAPIIKMYLFINIELTRYAVTWWPAVYKVAKM